MIRLWAIYPQGLDVEAADRLRKSNPDKYVELSYATMVRHVELMIRFRQKGALHLIMAITCVDVLLKKD